MKPITVRRLSLKRFIKSRFLRFFLAGGGNTFATYLLYLLLLQFMGYRLAYSITFVAGIAFGYLINAFWVFDKPPTARSALAYPVVYFVQYLMGLALLALIVEIMGVPQVIAPLIVVAFTLPTMFLMTKFIFSERVIYESQTKY